jgi:hypothetical protein
MAEYSFIFFIRKHNDGRCCSTDDPAMEIKALDLLFRIRKGVHLGSPEKTGYGYQVFIDNGRQRAMMLLYLLSKGKRIVLTVYDDYAHAFDIERMKDVNCTYSTVRYFYRKDQIDHHIGYSIHLEDSKTIKSSLITYELLDDVLKRHPELKTIRERTKVPEISFEEYKQKIDDYLRIKNGYAKEEINDVFEMYRKLLPKFYLMGFSVPAVAAMMYNEL